MYSDFGAFGVPGDVEASINVPPLDDVTGSHRPVDRIVVFLSNLLTFSTK